MEEKKFEIGTILLERLAKVSKCLNEDFFDYFHCHSFNEEVRDTLKEMFAGSYGNCFLEDDFINDYDLYNALYEYVDANKVYKDNDLSREDIDDIEFNIEMDFNGTDEKLTICVFLLKCYEKAFIEQVNEINEMMGFNSIDIDKDYFKDIPSVLNR